MRGLFLVVLLLAFPASGQALGQATKLAESGVPLKGMPAAGGGSGTGTGLECDPEEEVCIFQALAGYGIEINSDLLYLGTESGSSRLGITPEGVLTYEKARLVGSAVLQRDKNQLAISGWLQGAYNECSTGAGAVVGTLNADPATVGRWLFVTRVGANTCTVAVESGHTLDGVINGTTTVASAGWKTFVQTGDTSWETVASWPIVAGDLPTTAVNKGGTGATDAAAALTNLGAAPAAHSVTTGTVPYASSSTAFAATEVQRLSQDNYRISRGSNNQTLEICSQYTDASNYACIRINTSGSTPQLLAQCAGTGCSTYNGGFVLGSNQTTGIGRIYADGQLRVRVGSYGLSPESSTLSLSGAVNSTNVTSASGGNTWNDIGVRMVQWGSYATALTDATATSFADVALASGVRLSGEVAIQIEATDGTVQQSLWQRWGWSAVNAAGTITCNVSTAGMEVSAPSSGTLTNAVTCVAGASKVTLKTTADTSITTPTVLRANWQIPALPTRATVTAIP